MMYRNPRTKQEIAMNVAVASDPEYREYGVRPPRRLAKDAVPTSWDDLPREASRNWKVYRMSQYRWKASCPTAGSDKGEY